MLFIGALFIFATTTDYFLATNAKNFNKTNWICFVNPSESALKKCVPKCKGVGTYGWSESKEKAIEVARNKCIEEYKTTECYIDYCSKEK
jgi:hypothetical protein